MPVSLSGWLVPRMAGTDASSRLFLFHCAGGAASMYHAWLELFPSDIAVQCVQLPGRQDRIGVPPFTRMERLVDVLVDVVAAEDDGRPFGFFGHSMGALVAYRLSVALDQAGLRGPVLVGAAGWSPEGFRMPVSAGAASSDERLISDLALLGALPADLGDQDPALLSLVLPAIRADVALCAGYVDDGAPLRAPLVAYAGAEDPLMAPEAMSSWTARSEHYLGGRTYPGGHFFVEEHRRTVALDLAGLLRRQAG